MPDTLTWPDLPAAQQPEWPDAGVLDDARARLASLPPLVFAGECDDLRDRLAVAARGEAFVLMGGDCAERFSGANADEIRAKLKTVLQMAVVLTYGASMPVVKIGRMAGQYAKPRSSAMETIDGIEYPSYRGDVVNDLLADAEARIPDPMRLVEAYHRASATLNLVRAFTQGGYADLRQVHAWNTDFVRESSAGERYDQLAGEIDRALAFMRAIGSDPEELHRVEFYAAHEALLLDYERALTRIDSRTGLPYDVSGHFVWVGERTRQLDGAHIDFAATHPQPDRRQARADDHAGRRGRADRAARPGRRARTPDAHHPDGRRQGARRAAGAGREGDGDRASGRLGVRPDARQHVHGRTPATRPVGSTTSSTRSRASSRCTPSWARTRVASTSS